MRNAKASPFGSNGDDRRAELFGSILALSVGLAPASSPKGGATGVSVRLPLDEQSTMSRKR